MAPNRRPEKVKGDIIFGLTPSVLNSEMRFVYAPKRAIETRRAIVFENDLPTQEVVTPASFNLSMISRELGPVFAIWTILFALFTIGPKKSIVK